MSAFVNGFVPRHRALIVILSALAGFGLTVIWSAQFVDSTIGAVPSGTARTITPRAGHNIAAFGSVAPLLGNAGTSRARLVQTFKPLAWPRCASYPTRSTGSRPAFPTPPWFSWAR
jgi:hypothetical protein